MSHVEQHHAVANCDDRSAVGGEAGRCVRAAWKTKVRSNPAPFAPHVSTPARIKPVVSFQNKLLSGN